MRNKKLIKTAVCSAVLSASLMVSQQNINAAQEGSTTNTKVQESGTSQNISGSDEEQLPDSDQNTDNTEIPDENKNDADADPNGPAGDPGDEPASEQPAEENDQALP
ncbi:hypothetical protein NSB04_29340, partial [Blautia pseudococcoides]|nr:hypothetical protein [Blautia pseudococcoides]